MWCVVLLALVFGFCAVIAALWLSAAADAKQARDRDRERARIMRQDTVNFRNLTTVESFHDRRT